MPGKGGCPESLKASLFLYSKHLMPLTPSDLFVFTLGHHVEALKACFVNLTNTNPNIKVVAIPPHQWAVPEHVADESLWHTRFGPGYRIMGDWRLTHQMSFFRSYGYRYVMQTDDDAFLVQPVLRNLVSELQAGGFHMATHSVMQDDPSVMWGLAELTKYFIITEAIFPATLFDHCSPKDINGLFSRFRENDSVDAQTRNISMRSNVYKTGGWDFSYLYGNLLVVDLEFWYQPIVQRFVSLCRLSGGSWNRRWNEQGVIAMIWQLFIPSNKLHMFTGDANVNVIHDRKYNVATLLKKLQAAQQ